MNNDKYLYFFHKLLGCTLEASTTLISGPDGLRDHRVTVSHEPPRFIGETTKSPEETGDVNYLWRAARGMPPARSRSQCAGEIGWSVLLQSNDNYNETRRSGMQMHLGEFRQAVEDSHTHNYQHAWYPGPEDDASQIMNVYNYQPHHQNRPNILPVRSSSSAKPHCNLTTLPYSRKFNNSNNWISVSSRPVTTCLRLQRRLPSGDFDPVNPWIYGLCYFPNSLQFGDLYSVFVELGEIEKLSSVIGSWGLIWVFAE
ncbi:hypothetical protein CAPTEDRAFT_192832 [Capitella teleta]|uniref:Uncharacterized protein n=1 Tax=Capitella teleta TaxID=283909 RepID=R7UR49_CAPTE|nr:hypothetical protein CAPTEDRAFT_192832 [Capitella teleta]|eukprot:ELU05901.1 hypothetical protein CAPTEDRAFT_192832 [Capitella teleta]